MDTLEITMDTINSISYPIYFNDSLAELASFVATGQIF
jgi:hypothetical protein